MAVVPAGKNELLVKLVYWGVGLSGKTTNLQFIYSRIEPDRRSKMMSLATETERTLWFDFLPKSLAPIDGKILRLCISTVPGSVFYDRSRELILKGADGIVFVADSQRERIESNVESLESMASNLEGHGRSLADTPLVLQYNKRDLPNAMPVDELDAALNPNGVPRFECIAHSGAGVFDTLRGIMALVHPKLCFSGPSRTRA